jgi:hypothetical protein
MRQRSIFAKNFENQKQKRRSLFLHAKAATWMTSLFTADTSGPPVHEQSFYCIFRWFYRTVPLLLQSATVTTTMTMGERCTFYGMAKQLAIFRKVAVRNRLDFRLGWFENRFSGSRRRMEARQTVLQNQVLLTHPCRRRREKLR